MAVQAPGAEPLAKLLVGSGSLEPQPLSNSKNERSPARTAGLAKVAGLDRVTPQQRYGP